MIYPSKYNGINFSYDFIRESNTFNFGNQRKKLIISNDGALYLSFFYKATSLPTAIQLKSILNGAVSMNIGYTAYTTITDGYLFYFEIPSSTLTNDTTGFFQLNIDSYCCYSEICTIKSSSYLTTNEICKITAYNNDSRHGYLTETLPAFGFFKFSQLNSDFFINSKVDYEYSYVRKMILSSENNIGKRLTFLDLTMYQQNLLKWLCNTENLFIDGVKYQLISDFTELNANEYSEILDLQAEFIKADQTFYDEPATEVPTDIFNNNFFMK